MIPINKVNFKKYFLTRDYVSLSGITGRDVVNAVYIYSNNGVNIKTDINSVDVFFLPYNEYFGEKLKNIDISNIYISASNPQYITEQDYVNIEYWG